MPAVAKKKQTSVFGKRLRELRESAGLTQAELGERMGMTYQSVAKYERGATIPSFPVAERFAESLGVSLEEFRARKRA